MAHFSTPRHPLLGPDHCGWWLEWTSSCSFLRFLPQVPASSVFFAHCSQRLLLKMQISWFLGNWKPSVTSQVRSSPMSLRRDDNLFRFSSATSPLLLRSSDIAGFFESWASPYAASLPRTFSLPPMSLLLSLSIHYSLPSRPKTRSDLFAVRFRASWITLVSRLHSSLLN